MVEHVPVRILVQLLVLESFDRILGDIRPLASHRQFFKQSRVFGFHDCNLLLRFFIIQLIGFVLHDQTLQAASILSFGRVFFRLQQVMHASLELITALRFLDLFQIANLSFESLAISRILALPGTLVPAVIPEILVNHLS